MTHVLLEGRHHELGPSGAKRWLNCPGSVPASRGVKDKPSIFAAEGSVAHYVSELCRKEKKKATEFLGESYKVGAFEFVVDQEMADAVQEYVDWCDEASGTSYIEETVKLDPYIPEGFGTLDDARDDELAEVLTITEYKHGKGILVEAKDNEQLKLQALGLITMKELSHVKLLKLRVSQPRLGHKDEWEVPVAKVIDWGRHVVSPAVLAINFGSSANQFAAGEWCQFCRIKLTCPTRAASNVSVISGRDVSTSFDNLNISIATSLTNQQIAMILPRIGDIKKWVADVEAQAFTELMHGREVGGYKIVEGRSNRTFSVPEAEVIGTLEMEGLDVEQLYTKKLKSAPQVEAILGKKNPVLKLIMEKPKGKPTLAPETDKREPMSIEGLSEFEVLGPVEDNE